MGLHNKKEWLSKFSNIMNLQEEENVKNQYLKGTNASNLIRNFTNVNTLQNKKTFIPQSNNSKICKDINIVNLHTSNTSINNHQKNTQSKRKAND